MDLFPAIQTGKCIHANVYMCLIWYLEHMRCMWFFAYPQRKKMILLLLLFREVGAQVEQFWQLVGSRVAVVRSCRRLSKQLGKWELERRGLWLKGRSPCLQNNHQEAIDPSLLKASVCYVFQAFEWGNLWSVQRLQNFFKGFFDS